MLIKRLFILAVLGSLLATNFQTPLYAQNGMRNVIDACCECNKKAIMMVALFGFIFTIVFEDDFRAVPSVVEKNQKNIVPFGVSITGDAYIQQGVSQDKCKNLMNQFMDGRINKRNLDFLGCSIRNTQDNTKKSYTKQNKNRVNNRKNR